MGCGASKQQDDGSKTKYEKDDKPAPASKPAESKSEPKSAPAPAAAPAAAASPAAAPAAPAGAALPGREKHMPAPLLAVIGDSKEKDAQYLVTAFGHISDLHGMTVSCAAAKTGQVFAVQMTDEALQKAVDALHAELAGEKIESFFKLLASCFGKSDMKVTDGGAKVEMKLKKEMKWLVSLDKQGSAADVFKTTIAAFPKYYINVKKDKKATEADLTKKESVLNIPEAILSAGGAAEEEFAEELADLRDKAGKVKAAVQAQHGRVTKIKKEIERQKLGAASHPLDEMYACVAPPSRSPTDVPIDTLNWDTDVLESSWNLTDLGVSLFKHHELLDWKVDAEVCANFFTVLEGRCNQQGPFHGAKRCADCMVCMHHLLQALKKTNPKISKEDTLAAFLSACAMDLDHPGYGDTGIKRAGSMLAMVYSDLYMNGQNNLTALFEMMYNPHVNLLGKLTPDECKDVFESVREALFIKANVAMKTNMERIKELEDLVMKGAADWGAKDNIRHQITHAARLCDWSTWTRKEDLHRKWVQKVKDEFYAQGDYETSIGIAFSKWSPCCTGYGSNILDRFETRWTSDREKDGADFASGQVAFIERCVEPLAGALAKVAPDLEPILSGAKANRAIWEKEGGGSSAGMSDALSKVGKIIAQAGDAVMAARIGADGSSLWVTVVDSNGAYFQGKFDAAALAKSGASDAGAFVTALSEAAKGGTVTGSAGGGGYNVTAGGATLNLLPQKADGTKVLVGTGMSFAELRGLAPKYVERKIEEVTQKAKGRGNPAEALEGEAKALKGCLVAMAKQEEENKGLLAELEKELGAAGGSEPKVDEEDTLEIKVRNPLKCPLPKDGSAAPDRKAVDQELLKVIKSTYFCKPHAESDLEKELDAGQHLYVNAIQPYVSSEFQKMSKSLGAEKTQHVFELLKKLDDWDYDVFDLQTTMSGGIAGENLRNQPDGGALYITMYALVYKWQFMQKFNIDESKFLNWLSIVEAGYHPNPYHNSMHAADVLHIVHYCLGPGGGQAKLKCSDEKVFAALLSGAVHDFNHPGINNAFHVRCQNYLAVLFNDRSVNENIHASSVFELMRMDKFNILSSFKGEAYDRMRDDMVEFILGTDMGLHAMILSRFKKRIEEMDSKLHKSESDVNLGITMCVKLADISNCGRPQKLYHGWCNVIVDEFFQQGDRERLQGMAVSPFMDRFTTVMAKGQIGFMNFIVAPLFECISEWLEGVSVASSLAEENKGFWQENEDW